MKSRIWILGGLLSISLLLAVFSTAAVFAFEPDAAASSESASTLAGETNNAMSDKYVIADENGKIGVYYMGELIYLTDISTTGLRAVDRDLLGRGIETSSYEDVLRLLEDFGS